ncbi:hypothetical protein HanXRQr2_Chr06g0270701 [Helianthus annuus]|uniref:Uncharacterized protein n=1 Tax=Helianthus annuus TaxID=4232 RepID=A0A251TCM8_HELAN|nr:hypothetical protein HanXRQr2_Chr06g0270701 [Helianthus annuus]KAJ0959422.1 hypothetical protein HanPSC8_Chr00c105g0804651 [Helianthus annuus]
MMTDGGRRHRWRWLSFLFPTMKVVADLASVLVNTLSFYFGSTSGWLGSRFNSGPVKEVNGSGQSWSNVVNGSQRVTWISVQLRVNINRQKIGFGSSLARSVSSNSVSRSK